MMKCDAVVPRNLIVIVWAFAVDPSRFTQTVQFAMKVMAAWYPMLFSDGLILLMLDVEQNLQVSNFQSVSFFKIIESGL